MSDPSRRILSLKRGEGAGTPTIEERLHKVLAQAGLGSRRSLEERIQRGEVRLNGEVATIGVSVRTGDRVELDGRTFVATPLADTPRVLVYNKPEGEVTTRDDPEGRPTVFEKIPDPRNARWITVGRLDINTTGLLLLTTDGELANTLMHPSSEVEREYVCRVHGEVAPATVQRLADGIELEDGPARFDQIEPVGHSDSHAWFRVVVREGRNREVRRMWESVGHMVSRLKRVRYGEVVLPRSLVRGHFEELPVDRVRALKRSLGLDEVPGTLTLEPVMGIRRARPADLAPAPRAERAWTNGHLGDEGRELRAFDHVREDRPPPGRRARKGAPRRGATPDNLGNVARTPKPRGSKPARKRRGAAPGQEVNPAAFRSWYVPEDGVTGPNRADAKPAGPRSGKGGGARSPGKGGGKGGGQRPGGPPRGSRNRRSR
ncbi:MAG TPA: pseudouridine synthase [Xanthomonadaceae bacterium]|nr:pseudouridine synthase [Xanthomonadaceae bacterium]